MVINWAKAPIVRGEQKVSRICGQECGYKNAGSRCAACEYGPCEHNEKPAKCAICSGKHEHWCKENIHA